MLSRIPAHSITRLSEFLPQNWKPLDSPGVSLNSAPRQELRTGENAIHETLTEDGDSVDVGRHGVQARARKKLDHIGEKGVFVAAAAILIESFKD